MQLNEVLNKALGVALGVVISLVGVLAVSRFLGPIPLSISQTTTAKGSSFDVTGDAETNVSPDEATVSLGVNIVETTVKAAQDKANMITTAILSEMDSLGIEKEDVKTENYSLFPNYDFSDNRQRVVGYSVNTSVVVKVRDFDKLNQVIDAATAVGANQVGNISFDLSADKRLEVEEGLRAEAVEEAKTKAESLAKAAGIRLGRVVNVTEQQDAPKAFLRSQEVMLAPADSGGAAAPTQVEPGTSTIRYSVLLSYETF